MFIFSIGFGILLAAIVAEGCNPQDLNEVAEKENTSSNARCVAEKVIIDILVCLKCPELSECRNTRYKYEWICGGDEDGKRRLFQNQCLFDLFCCSRPKGENYTFIEHWKIESNCNDLPKWIWLKNDIPPVIETVSPCKKTCDEDYIWICGEYEGMRTLFENNCLMERYNCNHKTDYKIASNWSGTEEDCADCYVGRDTPIDTKWSLKNFAIF